MAQSGMETFAKGEADPPEPIIVYEAKPYRLTIPLLLAAGWGALLAFSAMCLIEDGRHSTSIAVADRNIREPGSSEPGANPRPRWDTADIGYAGANPSPSAIKTVSASVDSLSIPASLPPAIAAAPRSTPQLGFVGVWGPSAYACLTHSKRRGFIPATITETSAKAGNTLCRFRNKSREGAAWTMAAECSERGRNWSAQVRLLVDGDRLTWTSVNGSQSYIRCGRRG